MTKIGKEIYKEEMMRKRVILAGLIGLCLIFLTGCSQFPDVLFGIRVFRGIESVDKAFNNVRSDEKGNIRYSYDASLADNSITCRVAPGLGCIVFRIHNGSKQPIRMNYFADRYRVETKDGRIFILEIEEKISSYPSVLNPGQRATILIGYPSGVKLSDVEVAMVELDYGEVVIVLRRIAPLKTRS